MHTKYDKTFKWYQKSTTIGSSYRGFSDLVFCDFDNNRLEALLLDAKEHGLSPILLHKCYSDFASSRKIVDKWIIDFKHSRHPRDVKINPQNHYVTVK